MGVLPKRFGKFGLWPRPDKTRVVHFLRPTHLCGSGAGESLWPGSFDFLGFTHWWGQSRMGGKATCGEEPVHEGRECGAPLVLAASPFSYGGAAIGAYPEASLSQQLLRGHREQ